MRSSLHTPHNPHHTSPQHFSAPTSQPHDPSNRTGTGRVLGRGGGVHSPPDQAPPSPTLPLPVRFEGSWGWLVGAEKCWGDVWWGLWGVCNEDRMIPLPSVLLPHNPSDVDSKSLNRVPRVWIISAGHSLWYTQCSSGVEPSRILISRFDCCGSHVIMQGYAARGGYGRAKICSERMCKLPWGGGGLHKIHTKLSLVGLHRHKLSSETLTCGK